VSNITDFETLKLQIRNCAKNPAQYKALQADAIKITASDETDYRRIKDILREVKNSNDSEQIENPNNRIEYHTYQLKSETWFRFVIRGVPSSTKNEDIKKDIEKHGHQVATVTNIMKQYTKDRKKTLKIPTVLY